MEIATTRYKRCDVVRPEGRIDTSTAGQLEEVLKALMDEERFRIVLDMEAVNFVSSKGWWVLINTQKACKKNSRGEIVLVKIGAEIRSSLEIVGMDNYFRTFEDVTSAVGSF